MPEQSPAVEVSTETQQMPAGAWWRSQGIWAWLLSLLACLLAAIAALVVFYMLIPIDWDGIGKSGALALMFPLHLLVLAVVATGLGFLSWWQRARFAGTVFSLVAIVTAIAALSPTIAVWQQARQLDVPLSLSTYLTHAVSTNIGSPQHERSVVYATTSDGTKLELDVWQTGKGNVGSLRPAIVFVHGGAWVHGSRSGAPAWNQWLNELGYEVFDVEYRMPPPVRWQDEVGDVKSALGWVAVHAADYHIDPTRISMMGYSAGANLSMLAAYSMGDPQLPSSADVPEVAVRSVVNLYGPTDMELLDRSGGSRKYIQAALKQYIGGSPSEFPDRYRILSPLSHIGAKTSATITILGTSDRIVPTDHAIALDRALTQAGVVHKLYFLNATDHGFDANWGGFATQIARAKIGDFLQQYATEVQSDSG